MQTIWGQRVSYSSRQRSVSTTQGHDMVQLVSYPPLSRRERGHGFKSPDWQKDIFIRWFQLTSTFLSILLRQFSLSPAGPSSLSLPVPHQALYKLHTDTFCPSVLSITPRPLLSLDIPCSWVHKYNNTLFGIPPAGSTLIMFRPLPCWMGSS